MSTEADIISKVTSEITKLKQSLGIKEELIVTTTEEDKKEVLEEESKELAPQNSNYSNLNTPKGLLILAIRSQLKASIIPNNLSSILENTKTSNSLKSQLIINSTYDSVKTIVYKGIEEAKITELNRQLKLLGLNLSKAEKTKLLAGLDANKVFKGLTLNKRIHRLSNISKLDLKKILSKKMSIPLKTEQIKKYLLGTYQGRNGLRPATVVAVSEINRTAQEVPKELFKYLKKNNKLPKGLKFEWVLSTIAGRQKDICDVYAEHKYYTDKTIPSYPHPNCGCSINLV